jgi:type III pantothenate kinase
MLLAIDVGNSNIIFGIFEGERLIKQWRLQTFPFLFPKIKIPVDKVVIASVVPSLDRKLVTAVKKRFRLNPFFVTAQNIAGLKIKLVNKKEVGADRVVNALAAYKIYGGPAIVFDFGTATTFDVVSARGEYLGGAIAPGIMLARDALYRQTAKLPKIKIEAPRRVIGKNTRQAMRSGLVYGCAAMAEGMIERIKSSLVPRPSSLKIIATGGLAPLICKYLKLIDKIDLELTLKGLMITAKEKT